MSWSKGCSDNGKPTVYQSVASVSDWIHDVISYKKPTVAQTTEINYIFPEPTIESNTDSIKTPTETILIEEDLTTEQIKSITPKSLITTSSLGTGPNLTDTTLSETSTQTNGLEFTRTTLSPNHYKDLIDNYESIIDNFEEFFFGTYATSTIGQWLLIFLSQF